MPDNISINPRVAGWLPVTSSPAGLVSWYTPDGPAAASLASWLAVIDCAPPELRAGCPGLVACRERFPSGTDFVINIPADMASHELQELVRQTLTAGAVPLADSPLLLPSRTVRAPLLAGCTLQIECNQGRILPERWEPELVGTVALLRRGGLFVDPADYPEFCALAPLRSIFPS
jgi:hypothetical protein